MPIQKRSERRWILGEGDSKQVLGDINKGRICIAVSLVSIAELAGYYSAGNERGSKS
ncbi:MAG: hypothetical protein QXH67_07225 [Candidatus Bathyarchaeia archaeon]